ncbi:MAG: hypothetical protein JHD15_10910 [Phenylobacterium sp.]|uniref:hypothetical protein n=1 Tax=Phenylobacterium sp. TaxID=1871053 RepID=UPI001A26DC72|nr:hypothetical protein [Phenylobacterium sp.]MBJ7410853.1 hypothetical protein [Phenylobacterium sp.]
MSADDPFRAAMMAPAQPQPEKQPLLLRKSDWPKWDDAGEVFLGRALERILDHRSVTSDDLESHFVQILHALQLGQLQATALGWNIPRSCWRMPRGQTLMAACEITRSEAATGQPQGREHWWDEEGRGYISILQESLEAFLSGEATERGAPPMIKGAQSDPGNVPVCQEAEACRVQVSPQRAERGGSGSGRRRGPKPSVLPRVVAAMKVLDFAALEAMKEEEMVATFGAGRTTCRAARDKLRAELRQLPTDDK